MDLNSDDGKRFQSLHFNTCPRSPQDLVESVTHWPLECGLHDVFCESLNSFEFNQDGVGCHNASKQEMSLATIRCRPVFI